MSSNYSIIGCMSGTSLDGLDLAHCTFQKTTGGWQYEIHEAETIKYSEEWVQRLTNCMKLEGLALSQLDVDLGKLIGKEVQQFIQKHNLSPKYIASHGHTVFHEPHNSLTLQVGNGAAIYAQTSVPSIVDFRTLDVMNGGQGAPLVPIGDQLLFSEYDYCLNLGGIANITDLSSEKVIAFDVSPCNMVLNWLANKLDKAYDERGQEAAKGTVNEELLTQLNRLDYFNLPAPKSLGKEWVDAVVFPLLEKTSLSVQDILATYCEHIAMQLARVISSDRKTKLLVTGGGAYNQFLVDRFRYRFPAICTIDLLDQKVIEYKEALIFAFLGVLKVRNEPNCLASVTGASKDVCGGVIWND
ncbi:MAG: anhydro-N-acetylmuramic acid kinase [Cyclobacteriaceae bacterium]